MSELFKGVEWERMLTSRRFLVEREEEKKRRERAAKWDLYCGGHTTQIRSPGNRKSSGSPIALRYRRQDFHSLGTGSSASSESPTLGVPFAHSAEEGYPPTMADDGCVYAISRGQPSSFEEALPASPPLNDRVHHTDAGYSDPGIRTCSFGSDASGHVSRAEAKSKRMPRLHRSRPFLFS